MSVTSPCQVASFGRLPPRWPARGSEGAQKTRGSAFGSAFDAVRRETAEDIREDGRGRKANRVFGPGEPACCDGEGNRAGKVREDWKQREPWRVGSRW